jgi:hypothetical protein
MNFEMGYIVGFGSMIGLLLILTFQEPTKEQIGYTYQQLKEMKAECEKDLPRSTECSIVVYYLPQAELEKTE